MQVDLHLNLHLQVDPDEDDVDKHLGDAVAHPGEEVHLGYHIIIRFSFGRSLIYRVVGKVAEKVVHDQIGWGAFKGLFRKSEIEFCSENIEFPPMRVPVPPTFAE